MSGNDSLKEYTIEFTATVKVLAEDAVKAVELAQLDMTMDDMYIYVDGNLWN